jgi:hypothetical protein
MQFDYQYRSFNPSPARPWTVPWTGPGPPRGAPTPAGLFNASLDGNVRRAIDIQEGEDVDATAFKALVLQAIAIDTAGKSKPPKRAKS